MSEYKKNTYCSFCGSKFTEQESFPRKCFKCYNETFSNPIPVSITLIAIHLIDHPKKIGALIQKRNINPKKGEWALHGGYLNSNEKWKDGAVRELKEELNIDINTDNIKLFDVINSTNTNLLIFNYINYPLYMKDIPFVPNEEVSEIKVIDSPIELAFPTHNEMLERFLHAQQNSTILF